MSCYISNMVYYADYVPNIKAVNSVLLYAIYEDVFFIFSICYFMVLSISVHHLIIITINSEIWAISHNGRTWSNCMRCMLCHIPGAYRPGQDGRHAADEFFSWMKIYQYWLKFYWNLITISQSTILRHGLRLWLGAEKMTNHYQNQWWLTLLTHMRVSLPQWVKHFFHVISVIRIMIFCIYGNVCIYENCAIVLIIRMSWSPLDLIRQLIEICHHKFKLHLHYHDWMALNYNPIDITNVGTTLLRMHQRWQLWNEVNIQHMSIRILPLLLLIFKIKL